MTDPAGAIREAAATLFAARGYAGVSVREIAKSAGVDPALVIRHFRSKEKLFLETMQLDLDHQPLLDGPIDELGERFIQLLLDSDENARGIFLALLRASDGGEIRVAAPRGAQCLLRSSPARPPGRRRRGAARPAGRRPGRRAALQPVGRRRRAVARHRPPRTGAAVRRSPADPNYALTTPAETSWITAKCTVTDVTAGPVRGAGSALSNGSRTSSNWSGWQFNGPGTGRNYYDEAGMNWHVPAAEFGVLTTQRDASIWPGVGTGDSASDVLVQMGTQTTSGPAGVQATYPWTEIYPVQPTEVQITNLAAAAGDYMGATVTAQTVYHAQAVVLFDMCNQSHGQCVSIRETVPSGGTYTGQTAEFIVERPGINGGYSELDNFDYEQVNYASAHHFDGVFQQDWATDASWPGETTYKISMKSCNGSTLLAEPSNVPSGSPTGNFIVLWHNHGSLESC